MTEENNAPERRGDEEYEDLDPAAVREIARTEAFYSHIGPLPDPLTLRAYGEIKQDLPERIVSTMEGETNHRHKIESRGQIIAAVLVPLVVIAGLVAILFGYGLYGVLLAAVGVSPAFYGFFSGRRRT